MFPRKIKEWLLLLVKLRVVFRHFLGLTLWGSIFQARLLGRALFSWPMSRCGEETHFFPRVLTPFRHVGADQVPGHVMWSQCREKGCGRWTPWQIGLYPTVVSNCRGNPTKVSRHKTSIAGLLGGVHMWSFWSIHQHNKQQTSSLESWSLLNHWGSLQTLLPSLLPEHRKLSGYLETPQKCLEFEKHLLRLYDFVKKLIQNFMKKTFWVGNATAKISTGQAMQPCRAEAFVAAWTPGNSGWRTESRCGARVNGDRHGI